MLARVLIEREAGLTVRAIVDGLNTDGVRTATGGKWGPSSVHGAWKSGTLEREALSRVVDDLFVRRGHFGNITKFVVKADYLEDLVRLGTLTRAAARFLDASVIAGLNILVAGGTQAGRKPPPSTTVDSTDPESFADEVGNTRWATRH